MSLAWLGSLVALVLQTLLRLVAPPRCAVCAAFLTLAESHHCQPCTSTLCPPTQDMVDVVLAPYSGLIQAAIQDGKFNGASWRLRALGALLGRSAAAHDWDLVAVVPVPSTPRRLATRGYNPAAVIARACAHELGVPVVYALVRCQEGPAQHTLPKDARGAVRAAFQHRRPVAGTVLLVDDVTTTGNTIAGCADTLLEAGASNVYLATVAYTPLEDAAAAPPQAT